MELTSRSLIPDAPIPGTFAFGVPAEDAPMMLGPNRNPHLAWSGAPAGTRSYVLLCVDPDVPTVADDVNQEGRTIPHDLARCDFYHWVLVDVPTDVAEIAEGSCSDGVVSGGKQAPSGPSGSRQGLNDYTAFLAGSELAGKYFGYDGPCPPWNDERLHHYHFRILALDVDRVPVEGEFDGRAVVDAIAGHVLAQAELVGTYALNPDVA